MSEYFSGVTFAEQRVTPSDDGQLHRAILPDCFLSGCALSYSGTTLSMGAGALLLCGRQIRHNAAQNWPITGAVSGYARLVLTVDLSKTSTEDAFEQVVPEVQYATAAAGFAPLEQADINASGIRYQAEICIVSLGGSGITGIVSQLPLAGAADNSVKTAGSLAELDDLIVTGCYRLDASGNIASIYGVDFSRATVSVEAYDAENGHQVLRKLGSRAAAHRWRAEGIWSPWGIENPPLDIGTEYRTTELWNNSPVYTKLLSYAASEISTQNKLLAHGVSGLSACISAHVIWKRTDESPDGWRQLPSSDFSTGDWDGHVEYVDATNIKLRLGSRLQYRMKLSNEPIYVLLKYTKL